MLELFLEYDHICEIAIRKSGKKSSDGVNRPELLLRARLGINATECLWAFTFRSTFRLTCNAWSCVLMGNNSLWPLLGLCSAKLCLV